MRPIKLRLQRRGDTIVEVLIAIAIVSSVLAGAFTVTQKSSLAVRNGQERGEMLQILQGQVEVVRAIAQEQESTTTGIFATSPFCIDINKVYSPITASPAPNCQFGPSGRYGIVVTYNATTGIFTFLGSWDGPSGSPQQARLLYRTHAGQALAP